MSSPACEKNKNNDRSFTIHSSSTGFTGGRFKGDRTKAAKKAGSRLYKVASPSHDEKAKRPASIKFELRETTRGSDKKITDYEAKYKLLSCPRVRWLPDPEDPEKQISVTYTHSVVVRAVA